MSDDAADAVDTPEPEQSAPDTTTEDQRVPLDRFRTVTAENKELRSQLDELSRWKEEQEQAQLTELERERQAREKAEQQLIETAARATSLERSAWIRTAALNSGFADPEDAVALIGTDVAEDADTAAQLVTALAEKKPHLLAAPESGPKPIGAPIAQTSAQVPVDSDGKPDVKAGLGNELLAYVRGQRG
jgi:hypothetical protein